MSDKSCLDNVPVHGEIKFAGTLQPEQAPPEEPPLVPPVFCLECGHQLTVQSAVTGKLLIRPCDWCSRNKFEVSKQTK